MHYILQGFKGDGSTAMWAILALAVIALAIILERVYYIYIKASMGRSSFMRNIARMLQSGRTAEAAQFAQQHRFPLANVISAVLNNREKGDKAMEKAVDEVYLTEAPRLTRYLNLLITMANVATLTGLIGTIFGLIISFDAVGNLPAAQRPQALAKGISIAMGTTFAGLFVAIPTMVVHGLLGMQAERLTEELEEKAVKVMNLL